VAVAEGAHGLKNLCEYLLLVCAGGWGHVGYVSSGDRLDRVVEAGWLSAAAGEIAERCLVDDGGDGVPYLHPHVAQSAGGLAGTAISRTGLVLRAAGAGGGGEGAIHDADDFADGDFRGRAAESVAPVGSTASGDEAGGAEGAEELFQVTPRDGGAIREFGQRHRLLRGERREFQECADGVIATRGEFHGVP